MREILKFEWRAPGATARARPPRVRGMARASSSSLS